MMIDGVLNLNKPQGITSRQALDRIRKLWGVKKAGHGGTLDPDATGVVLNPVKTSSILPSNSSSKTDFISSKGWVLTRSRSECSSAMSGTGKISGRVLSN